MSQPNLTVAYVTARQDSKIEWFLSSLKREGGYSSGIRVVVVDAFASVRSNPPSPSLPEATTPLKPGERSDACITWTSPKPSPWQGPHKLTKQEWFAAANARNTALCLAPDGWIAYVDDLSVLMPGWLSCVREAMSSGYIICGAYKKVKRLEVDPTGLATNYQEFPGGLDNRMAQVSFDPTLCAGNWLYGCSCAVPVEALLQVNGWPEDLCDGMGFEDVCCGIVLENAGWKFAYDRRMLTLESEEHHHIEAPFRRDDWHFDHGQPARGGNGGPDDKSHRALAIAQASKRFPNRVDFRALRAEVLAGGAFPTTVGPEHDWYTGKALKDL